ncbi:MAG: bifunctional uridylyltransferase/uridylyl-removing protein, partial [Pseudomonadota bacterium]
MSEVVFLPPRLAALGAAFDAAFETPAHDPGRARAAILPVAKTALTDARERIRAAFQGDDPNLQLDGRGCVRAASLAMDALVSAVARYASERVYRTANPTEGERFAVIACGGYGRGELAPASDVDLLFLTADRAAPRVEQIVEFTLYFLWDLGLTVGHATRSIAECVRRAKGDATIMTTLLETRRVFGDDALFKDFRRRYFDDALKGGEARFIAAKLEERDVRHEKHGASRYMLEPNIKEGKGGLRDLQTLFWLAKAAYAVETPDALVAKGVLTRSELRSLNTAHEFLTALRCTMHYAAGREDDRLTFDLQTEVGRRMGFADRAGAVAVERLLKRYFLAAKDVGDLTRVFCAAMEEAYAVDTRSLVGRVASAFARAKSVDGFTAANGRLDEAEPGQFDRAPVEMMRIFRVAQIHGFDVHPNALRRIRGLLPKIAMLRTDATANALFLEILAAREDPEAALRGMNEAGVLGRFIPEFGRVVAMAQ